MTFIYQAIYDTIYTHHIICKYIYQAIYDTIYTHHIIHTYKCIDDYFSLLLYYFLLRNEESVEKLILIWGINQRISGTIANITPGRVENPPLLAVYLMSTLRGVINPRTRQLRQEEEHSGLPESQITVQTDQSINMDPVVDPDVLLRLNRVRFYINLMSVVLLGS